MQNSNLSDKFNVGERVIYPSHGIGTIQAIETQIIGGYELQVYVITLERENVTLRVPVKKALSIGLRAISNKDSINKVIDTLQGKPKTGKGMWSKRAQEYESKINSGDIIAIAEVVRDLYRNATDPDRSYSERIIYESALQRLSGEYAAIEKVEIGVATTKILELLIDTLEAA